MEPLNGWTNGPMVMRTDWMGGRDAHDDTLEAREILLLKESSKLSVYCDKPCEDWKKRWNWKSTFVATNTGSCERSRTSAQGLCGASGHDNGSRDVSPKFLEQIELEAIILHEQPDQGFTIIEKFEKYASQVAFAVVLLTPLDDLVVPSTITGQVDVHDKT